jgi:hypothetical protein
MVSESWGYCLACRLLKEEEGRIIIHPLVLLFLRIDLIEP